MNSHWDYLEPTHLVGSFIHWVALSLFLGIVGLVVLASLGWSLWAVLLSPVVALAITQAALAKHMKDIQKRMEETP